MNILLCSTGINALGETFTIALFAKELEETGNKCFFIAPKLGKDYLLTFGFEKNKILVLRNISEGTKEYNLNNNKKQLKQFEKEILPDFILVADWHHYKEDGISNNKTYSIYWFDENIPMGTFDHVGFAPAGRNVKQDQIINVTQNSFKRDFQEKEFPPLHDRFSFIIRPCPHHNNSNPNVNNIYYWGIYKEKIISNYRNRSQILKKYNVREDSKIIFQPVGLWQERVIDKVFEEINIKYDYYEETLFPIILHYLSKVETEITYIVISGKVKEESMKIHDNVRFITIPPLKHNEFMDMLMCSDLFITDNLMSSNLGKAVFANILPLVFKNSIFSNSEKHIKSDFQLSDFIKNKLTVLIENNLLFPYRSFPIGLCELEEMYEDNNFQKCFVETEIFNEQKNTELFKELLFENKIAGIIRQKQNIYIKNNSNLYSSVRILKFNK